VDSCEGRSAKLDHQGKKSVFYSNTVKGKCISQRKDKELGA